MIVRSICATWRPQPAASEHAFREGPRRQLGPKRVGPKREVRVLRFFCQLEPGVSVDLGWSLCRWNADCGEEKMMLSDRFFGFVLASLWTSGCLGCESADSGGAVEETTGEVGATEPEVASSSTSVASTGGSSGADTTTSTDEPTGGAEATGSDTGTGDEFEPECVFEPEPLECDPSAGAIVDVSFGSEVPTMTSTCTVDSIGDLSPSTQSLVLACRGLDLSFEITSENPHLPLPLSEEQTVLLESLTTLDGVRRGVSFKIADLAGVIIAAYIDQPSSSTKLDISPLEYSTRRSGCESFDLSDECSPGDAIVQRTAVAFTEDESRRVFDGNSRILQVEGTTFDISVGKAHQPLCWLSECAPSLTQVALIKALIVRGHAPVR